MTVENYAEMRNIAIIAHVDHGKTTLVDAMLRQSNNNNMSEVDSRVMDCNALEQERGITILAKCTSLYRDNIKYNIVDTPGHADFGGEVERILQMVDGVIVLVDSSEGPMSQTKFVLSKALKAGLKPIVVINKVDRPDSRIDEVLDEILDLFISLDANDDQVNFPVLYAVGRDGWASKNANRKTENLDELFDTIREYVSPPVVDINAPFSMLATILTADQYVGRILIGKVYTGKAKVGSVIKSLNLEGQVVENTKLTKLFGFRGIEKVPIDEARAGDIIAVAGAQKTSVADTICDVSVESPIPSTIIDPPTMSITIGVNDSPLAGLEGKKLTSRMILERLQKEAEINVAISLSISDTGESFEIGGRGELQLGVLIEMMRREGFELSVSRPKILIKEENGKKYEPIEEVIIDVDEEFSGTVIEQLMIRRGDMVDSRSSGGNKVRMTFHVPSRGLIGYQSEFRNSTRGTGVLNRLFHGYSEFRGAIAGRRNGVLVSNATGNITGYALFGLEDRGRMFVSPKQKTYEGMIIGEHNRDNDLDVNVVKAKQVTNIRAAGNDENITLTPPKIMTLEEALSYIQDGELIEVTPNEIRLRKEILQAGKRKR